MALIVICVLIFYSISSFEFHQGTKIQKLDLYERSSAVMSVIWRYRLYRLRPESVCACFLL